MVNTLDADGCHGRAGHRGQQDATQGIAERQPETTLQGIHLEFCVVLCLLKDLDLGIKLFEQFGAPPRRLSKLKENADASASSTRRRAPR